MSQMPDETQRSLFTFRRPEMQSMRMGENGAKKITFISTVSGGVKAKIMIAHYNKGELAPCLTEYPNHLPIDK